MQNRRALVLIAALSFSVAAPGQKVDLEQAQKDLDFVFERPPGRVDAQLVQSRFAAFWRKYDGRDLGRLAYAKGLSLYWNRQRDKALVAFDGYLAKYDPAKIPSGEQRATMGRAYLSAAVAMARSQRIDADRFVDIAAKFARCYHHLESVAGIVTRYLDKEHASLAGRARVAMVKEVMKKANVTPAETDAIMRAIYSSAPSRAAAGRRRVAARVRPAAPTTIKAFTETAMSGRVIDLKAYRGQVVLVDFWATWCGPCLREMPRVAAAFAKHHKNGFEIIGVSLDKKGAENKIAAVAEKFAMPWEQIYDGGFWSAKLAKENGIRSIPSAFLIDRRGNVRFSGRDTRGVNLLKNLQLLLAEKQK